MAKVIGRARALARGYYPVNDAGNCALIEPGDEFDLREGHEAGPWFERLQPEVQDKPVRAPRTKKPEATEVDDIA